VPRPPDGWRQALALVVALEVTLALVGLNAHLVGGREPFVGSWESLVIKGGGLLGRVLSQWQRWDALWYQHIAQSGYQPGSGSLAFFPLYPLLSRALSLVTFGNVVVAELVLSGSAFVAALWLLWRLTERELPSLMVHQEGASQPVTHGTAVALLSVLLLAFFPTAFFFLGPFTEGLFLLLALASMSCSRTGRHWQAGLFGFLAGLTRAQGIFLVLPLAYEHLRQRGSLSWLIGRGGQRPPLALLASAMPAMGLAAFGLYQMIVLQRQFGLLGAEAPWGYQVVSPWQAIDASLRYIDTVTNTNAAYVEVLNLGSLIVFTALGAVAVRKLPFAYSLYTLQSVGILLFREMWMSPLMSVSRYVLAVFPCFWIVAAWLAPRPRLAALWLLVSLFLQLALFQYFTRWGFVA
jgi:Gpi18-like mannosyltransferase